MTVFKWSTTAASNNTADSSINLREGQAPSTLNDAVRAIMAAIAKWRDDLSGNLVTGGTSTAYTVTTNQGYTALTDGIQVTVRMSATNGASPTLAVDGLTAKAIATVYGTAIPSGALLSGSVQTFTYDSTDDKWIVSGSRADYLTIAANPDLVALEAVSTTGIVRRTGSATWDAGTAGVTDLAATTANRLFGTNGSGTSGLVTLTAPMALASGALSVGAASDSAAGVQENAVQSEMESGASTTLTVTPGRQHFHPSATKAWGNGGVAADINASYAMSSLTDTANGQATWNLAITFSSSDNMCPCVSNLAVGALRVSNVSSKTTTTVLQIARDGGGSANDPALHFIDIKGDI